MCERVTQTSFVQFQRYKTLLAEEAEEGQLEDLAMIDHGAIIEFLEDVDKDNLEIIDGFILLSPGKVKPLYATVLKQGAKRAPPARGYATAATAHSGIPPTLKAPTKKKPAPPRRERRWTPTSCIWIVQLRTTVCLSSDT